MTASAFHCASLHLAAAFVVDSLERRILLSASIHHRTLQIIGTNGSEIISADTDGTTTVVAVNGSQQTIADSAYDRIDVDARGGDDSVTLGINILKPSTLRGGDGNDNLTGGGGDDVLVAGLGNDTLDGGGTYDNPAGLNTVNYSDRHQALDVQGNTLTTAGGETDVLVKNIQRFVSGSGNDKLNIQSASAYGFDFVDGGAGDDSISVSSVTDVTAHGGAGNDRIFIYARGQTGYYFGDGGNDTFTVERSTGTARDFNGGPGIDTVDYTGLLSFSYSVTVTLDDVQNDGSPAEYEYQPAFDNVHSDIERVIGTSGSDRIIGSGHDEALIGGAGDDVLIGGGGRDSLEGDSGNDLLAGNAGKDTLNGAAGSDSLIGADKHDKLYSDADDTVIDEPLALVNGALLVEGNERDNLISVLEKSGDPSSIVAALDGESQTFAKSDVNRVILMGNGGDDTITLDNTLPVFCLVLAGDGNDTVSGGDGGSADGAHYGYALVMAGAGDDSIVSGTGFNYIYAGAGDDTITLVAARFSQVSAEDGNDTVSGNGTVEGGRGDDNITGDGLLIGGPGNDTVKGGDGNDVFRSSRYDLTYIPLEWSVLGDDSIEGGGGNDHIDDYSGSNTLLGQDGNDSIAGSGARIDGGNGDDTLAGTQGTSVTGGAGNDSLAGSIVDGGNGNDTLQGGTEDDTLLGGTGDDSITGDDYGLLNSGNDFIDAGDGNDTVNGAFGNDTILGGDGNDSIHGGPGNDSIDCGAGDDTAFGEDGDDTLIGGLGNDSLDGGPGNNVIYQDFPPMHISPKVITLLTPELG
jgi:Ca2+-binding RTX toxin-like protein